MEKNSLLRQLPKVDEVLRRPPVAALELPQTVVTDLVRGRIEELRQRILEGSLTSLPTVEELCDGVCADAAAAAIRDPAAIDAEKGGHGRRPAVFHLGI